MKIHDFYWFRGFLGDALVRFWGLRKPLARDLGGSRRDLGGLGLIMGDLKPS